MSRNAVASYLEAEVKCLHCGHTSGLLRRDRGVPQAQTIYHSHDGGEAMTVRSLTQLRCNRCKGSVFTDEFETRYVYPKVDLFDDKPRRGRPPKRLVELRKLQAEQALMSA